LTSHRAPIDNEEEQQQHDEQQQGQADGAGGLLPPADGKSSLNAKFGY
jgi:hypothetical protein